MTPFDAHLGHELQGAAGAALDGLPAFHRQVLGARNQGQLFQLVAAVRTWGGKS